MDIRQKYALTSLLLFILCVSLFIYGAFTLGVFSKNKIIVTTLATTGADFAVVLGQLKLKMQMPDTIDNSDVGGLMVTDQSANDLDKYLENNYLAYEDYFVLTGKMVGVQQSDSDSFHPLFEISSWKHIDKLAFWTFTIIDIILLALFRLFYKKYKRKVSSQLVF